MRVAVRHTDENHENSDWFAYAQGRIEGFTHPVTGESFSAVEVTTALLDRAKSEYPEEDGYEHRVETLHAVGLDDDGHEVGGWFEAGSSDLPRAGQGGTSQQELIAAQGQESDNA